MSDQLRAPAHAVDRPALREMLDTGVAGPLTLLVAPAGAGKTVLLSQWVSSHPERAVVWIDAGDDDDPVSFAARLAERVCEAVPSAATPRAPIDEAGGGLGPRYVEAVAAELAGADVVLIFDDLHRLDASIVADLWHLVELVPPGVHVVFSSRVDLGLPWSRHRLQHGLVELRERELAFDTHDTAKLLERLCRTEASDMIVAAVLERCEGWAAGVQLAGLMLRTSPGEQAFLDRIADPDRLFVDYLTEEVLRDLDAPRRATLMRLSVLDEFDEDLVVRVGGAAVGSRLLESWERESMFVVPLAGRPGRYRFHHLFRDVLRYTLRVEGIEDEPAVLRAAARRLLDRGETTRAIEYLLAAGDWRSALDAILGAGRETFEQVQTSAVARWLTAVPQRVRAEQPRAELLRAIAEGMSGRASLAADILHELLASPTLDVGERLIAKTYLSAAVQFLPHPGVYRDAALDALADLAANPHADIPPLMQLTTRPFLETLARASLGRAYLLLGDAVRARDELVTALEVDRGEYAPYRVHVLGSLAIAEAFAGRLPRASELAEEALLITETTGLSAHPAPGDAHIARAIVAVQRGRPELGATALDEGYMRAASNQRVQLMWIAHLASQLVDPSGADPAAIAPPGPPPPLVRAALRAEQMRRARLEGEPERVESVAPGWNAVVFEQIAALLAKGRVDEAEAALSRAPRVSPRLAPSSAAEQAMFVAWSASLRHRRDRQHAATGQALAICTREDHVHLFARFGSIAVDLVEAHPDGASEFGRRVVASVRRNPARPASDTRLADPLTAREREILTFLPTRLTVAEIAARCYVSANTVKTHMAHIYRKLDAAGRDDAIARAAELDLLAPADQVRTG